MKTDLNILGEKAREAAAQLVRLGTEDKNRGLLAAADALMENMSGILDANAKDMEEDLKKARKDRVFITHSGSDPKTVDEVRAYLEGLGQFDEILETRAGGVVSSHCGPGTLGVLFILS